jgi:alpha-ketoglutarate-dependent taurine dioxygenase
MSQTYDGVITRHLNRTERRVPSEEEETPLVIEPSKVSNKDFLLEFLQQHSARIHTDLAKHGAILLRGFGVDRAGDFERVMLSIRGMCGIHEILLSEPGRVIVDGTRFIFYTSTLGKTGGTLSLGSFHTENYYVPEVPRYIAFFCEVPGRLGGETGLLNVAKVYAALPDELQRKLEERACVAGYFAVPEMAARYGVLAQVIERFCEDVPLPISDLDGKRYITVYKPSVVEHPVTHERALQINFGALSALQEPLVRAFLPDYAGARWFVHRTSWKYPWLASWSTRRSGRRFHLAARTGHGSHPRTPDAGAPEARTVASLFIREEVQLLATYTRRYYSSFPWRRGDILIIDNLKIAHSGMAGTGKREVKAMMCNPLVLSGLATSPGLRVIANTLERSTGLCTRLLHVREGRFAPDAQHRVARYDQPPVRPQISITRSEPSTTK